MTLECWPNGVQKLTPREHAYCARIERMLVAQLDHQMLSDAYAPFMEVKSLVGGWFKSERHRVAYQ